MTDPLTGFFLFRRQIVAGVDLQPIGWKISLEVLVRGAVRRPVEVPYTFARRADGDSKATISQGLLVLRHFVVLLLGRTVGRYLTTLQALSTPRTQPRRGRRPPSDRGHGRAQPGV